MSYKFSKGAQVIGDLKAADDTQRDTKIDFEEDYIALHTSGSAVLVVSGSKVGIGTTTPDYELDVAGNIGVNQYIYHNGDANTWINFTDNRIRLNAGGNNFIDCEDPGSAPHKVRINNGGNNIDFVIKDNSGNVYFTADASTARVGIGTDTPGELLHVSGNIKAAGDDVRIKLDGATDSHPGLELYENGTRKWIVYNDYTDDKLVFKTNTDVTMVIEQDGKVGIGSDSPSHKLDVNGDIRVRGNDIRDNSGNPAITFDGSANTTVVNNLTVQDYTFPSSDGSANQVLQTNGSGQLSFANAGGGGAGSSNRSVYIGYVSLQTTSRVVSYDLGTSLGPTANNNFKGMIIVPFDGTLDTVIVSPKGQDVTTANFGSITVSAFKNQSNFTSGTDVVVAGDNFQRKTPEGSTNPKIFSGEFDFSLSVSAGDLIQIKAARSSGGTTDTLVTVVFTES